MRPPTWGQLVITEAGQLSSTPEVPWVSGVAAGSHWMVRLVSRPVRVRMRRARQLNT